MASMLSGAAASFALSMRGACDAFTTVLSPGLEKSVLAGEKRLGVAPGDDPNPGENNPDAPGEATTSSVPLPPAEGVVRAPGLPNRDEVGPRLRPMLYPV